MTVPMNTIQHQLDLYVTTNQELVTAKWLSDKTSIPLNEAYREIEEYWYRHQDQVIATHLIHGVLQDGSHQISILSHDQIESLSSFRMVLWNKIYTLQKRPIADFGTKFGSMEKEINLDPIVGLDGLVIKEKGPEVKTDYVQAKTATEAKPPKATIEPEVSPPQPIATISLQDDEARQSLPNQTETKPSANINTSHTTRSTQPKSKPAASSETKKRAASQNKKITKTRSNNGTIDLKQHLTSDIFSDEDDQESPTKDWFPTREAKSGQSFLDFSSNDEQNTNDFVSPSLDTAKPDLYLMEEEDSQLSIQPCVHEYLAGKPEKGRRLVQRQVINHFEENGYIVTEKKMVMVEEDGDDGSMDKSVASSTNGDMNGAVSDNGNTSCNVDSQFVAAIDTDSKRLDPLPSLSAGSRLSKHTAPALPGTTGSSLKQGSLTSFFRKKPA